MVGGVDIMERTVIRLQRIYRFWKAERKHRRLAWVSGREERAPRSTRSTSIGFMREQLWGPDG